MHYLFLIKGSFQKLLKKLRSFLHEIQKREGKTCTLLGGKHYFFDEKNQDLTPAGRGDSTGGWRCNFAACDLPSKADFF